MPDAAATTDMHPDLGSVPGALASIARIAHTLANEASPAETFEVVLRALAEPLGAASAAVLVPSADHGALEVAAAVGIGDEGRAALSAAVRNPAHPVARTFIDAVSGFNVTPMAPGGPALRTHVPLIVARDGTRRVLGVLALAHDRPIEPPMRPLAEAAADLAAVAIELGG